MIDTRPQKDSQTVTFSGERIQTLIDGVRLHYVNTQVDERGSICEIFNPAWNFHEAPLVYVYQMTIRPNHVKGWVVHYEQDDRIFLSQGSIKIVLYDDRPQSPTYRMINEIYMSEYRRGLIIFPHHVYHAIQNIGDKDALLLNMPTKPYNHENPDKYRLPLENDVIGYRFNINALGW
jgi:dTDP-4-dehydrorhamnose 3,5-epimerase